MEIRFDQQETKYPDAIKWGDRLLGPKKGKFVESTAQRFSSSNGNPQKDDFHETIFRLTNSKFSVMKNGN
jgi:hypothetical protein